MNITSSPRSIGHGHNTFNPNELCQGGQSNQACAAEAQVPREIRRLFEELERQAKLVEQLASKLSPLLAPMPSQQCEKDGKPPMEIMAELPGRIGSARQLVEQNSARLAFLLNGIEL